MDQNKKKSLEQAGFRVGDAGDFLSLNDEERNIVALRSGKPKPLTGVLRLKLGACRTSPTKRLAADLHDAARQLNQARNAMARAWQRWREDHPGWTPPQKIGKDGQPVVRKNGRPVYESPAFPKTVRYEDREITFGTYLYHVGRKVAPHLSGSLVTKVSKEVLSHLTTNLPYSRSRQRWEEVLACNANLDTFRSLIIPVPNCNATICCNGAASGDDESGNKPLRDRMHLYGDSGCAVLFPLWSTDSGRKHIHAVVSINVGKLPAGLRNVIRQVCTNKWKFSDSSLVFIEKKGWFLNLVYQQPADALPTLDRSRVARLSVSREGDRPFLVSSDFAKEWQVGNGPRLVQEFRRLDARRKAMRNDYGTAGHGRVGHGRERSLRDVRPLSIGINHLTNDVAAKAADEVVKYCTKFDCGTLAWVAPALAARDHLWFSKNGVQWDWTLFESRLKNQCAKAGITIVAPNQAPANGHAGNGSMNERSATRGRRSGSGRRSARQLV